MQEQLDKDLKSAMLGGDKVKTETLRGLKNALQYEAVALGAQQTGLSDEVIEKVLAREAKKRQEAIDLYQKAGETSRVEAERAEKDIIDSYLPEQVDEAAIETAVQAEVAKLSDPSIKDIGRVIGAVKANLGTGADGSVIARLAKQLLEG